MGRGTIVVVDDEPGICDLLSDILTDEGYTVVCTNSGSDGVAAVRQHRPDVVLLDIHLLGALDGLTVANLLRATPATATIPIIVSTADNQFLRDKAPELYNKNYAVLSKPFEIDELLASVERAISSHQMPAAMPQQP